MTFVLELLVSLLIVAGSFSCSSAPSAWSGCPTCSPACAPTKATTLGVGGALAASMGVLRRAGGHAVHPRGADHRLPVHDRTAQRPLHRQGPPARAHRTATAPAHRPPLRLEHLRRRPGPASPTTKTSAAAPRLSSPPVARTRDSRRRPQPSRPDHAPRFSAPSPTCVAPHSPSRSAAVPRRSDASRDHRPTPPSPPRPGRDFPRPPEAPRFPAPSRASPSPLPKRGSPVVEATRRFLPAPDPPSHRRLATRRSHNAPEAPRFCPIATSRRSPQPPEARRFPVGATQVAITAQLPQARRFSRAAERQGRRARSDVIRGALVLAQEAPLPGAAGRRASRGRCGRA